MLAKPTGTGASTTGVTTTGTGGDAKAIRPVAQRVLHTILNGILSSSWSAEEAPAKESLTEPLSLETLLTKWLSLPDELMST